MTPALFGAAMFDTSAQSYFARDADESARKWLTAYVLQFRLHLCPLTVVERMHGYWTLLRRSMPSMHREVERAMAQYRIHLRDDCNVLPFDTDCALISAELMALHSSPPSPPRRSHRAQ